jgi:hypothetical protein
LLCPLGVGRRRRVGLACELRCRRGADLRWSARGGYRQGADLRRDRGRETEERKTRGREKCQSGRGDEINKKI